MMDAMTTKQKKYADGLKAKGLMRATAVIPIDKEPEHKKLTAKWRKQHKQGEK